MIHNVGDRIEVVGKGLGAIVDIVKVSDLLYYVVMLDTGGQVLVRVA